MPYRESELIQMQAIIGRVVDLETGDRSLRRVWILGVRTGDEGYRKK